MCKIVYIYIALRFQTALSFAPMFVGPSARTIVRCFAPRVHTHKDYVVDLYCIAYIMLGCLLIISCRFMQLKLTLLNLQVCNRHASCRVLITKVWLLTCFFNSLKMISHFFLTSCTICNIHFLCLNNRAVKST